MTAPVSPRGRRPATTGTSAPASKPAELRRLLAADFAERQRARARGVKASAALLRGVRDPGLRRLAPRVLALVGEASRLRTELAELVSRAGEGGREADRWMLAVERARAELVRALAGPAAVDAELAASLERLREDVPHLFAALAAGLAAVVANPDVLPNCRAAGADLPVGAELADLGLEQRAPARRRAGRAKAGAR